MEGINAFRPIQCYTCFVWCKHFKPECPNKYDPQICSRCARIGHDYKECSNAPFCLNCQGSHPATARICPEYTKAVQLQLPIIAKQLAYLLGSTTSHTDAHTHIDTHIYRHTLTHRQYNRNRHTHNSII